MMGQQPILLIKDNAEQQSGKTALDNNITAARAVADAVRTTLGPRGMDKMLVNKIGDVVITNDGVTILKEIDVEHPAAKMIVEVAKTQDDECGDGTTTAVILAGEMLKQSQSLVDKNVHPTIITKGYSIASQKAIEILNEISEDMKKTDTDMLKKIAVTSMTGKSAESMRDILANIAVEAISKAGLTDNVKIVKVSGAGVASSELVSGIILDSHRVHPTMPEKVSKAKIALLNCALEFKKTEIEGKYQFSSPEAVDMFIQQEEAYLTKIVDDVVKSGANVVFTTKGMDDTVQFLLAKKNVYGLRRISEKDMELLIKATGAKLVSKISQLTEDDLGKASTVEEAQLGEQAFTILRGCPSPKAVTILVRGGTAHVSDEIERALVDALSVVEVATQDCKVTVGGGAAAMEIAQKLKVYAPSVGGREEMAILAYAEALEVIPKTLAENAGLDPIDIIIELRKAHTKGNKTFGLNVYNGKIEDMKLHNVIEPLRVGMQAIIAATETANMILRIDDIIASRASGKQPQTSPGAPIQPV